MKQWLVRAAILGAANDATYGINNGTLQWFPDHPAFGMNNNNFWNDPYPESELPERKVEGFFHPAQTRNPMLVIEDLASIVRGGLQNVFTTVMT